MLFIRFFHSGAAAPEATSGAQDAGPGSNPPIRMADSGSSRGKPDEEEPIEKHDVFART
jgi:hypothetical protein